MEIRGAILPPPGSSASITVRAVPSHNRLFLIPRLCVTLSVALLCSIGMLGAIPLGFPFVGRRATNNEHSPVEISMFSCWEVSEIRTREQVEKKPPAKSLFLTPSFARVFQLAKMSLFKIHSTISIQNCKYRKALQK